MIHLSRERLIRAHSNIVQLLCVYPHYDIEAAPIEVYTTEDNRATNGR